MLNHELSLHRENPMDAIIRGVVNKTTRDLLPGSEEFALADIKVSGWIRKQWARVSQARTAEDPVFLESALGAWARAWIRVFELMAKDYLAANADVAAWELRYFKWMKGVCLKCEGPLGVFFMAPRRYNHVMKDKLWYSADDMLELLEGPESIRVAIKLFGALPIKKADLPSMPLRGENFLYLDLTGSEVSVKGIRRTGG